MLKFAANTVKTTLGTGGLKVEAPITNYLKDNSPRTVVKNIPIQQFKQSNFIMKDGKLIEMKGEAVVQEESKEKSPTNFQEALRLPNISMKQKGSSPSNAGKARDGFSSPSNFLSGNNEVAAHVFDNLKSGNNDGGFI